MTSYGLGDRWPQLRSGVFIAPPAAVIGDVVLGARVSVWFGAVIRGDETLIAIGAGTNIQDGTVIHSNCGVPEVVIGERVTVGYGARLHGCRIEADALIGIGSTVLDGAEIESGAIVAAGALIGSAPANSGRVCPPCAAAWSTKRRKGCCTRRRLSIAKARAATVTAAQPAGDRSAAKMNRTTSRRASNG